MFDLLATILAFFYDLVPNYAVAIGLLTITVMAALTPFMLKGTRSMLAMQKLQPEMRRLQEMHRGDRQAQNEALMEFYKEHKINPLSGCLPMLLQFPVMIVLFNVVNGLSKTTKIDGRVVGTPKYLDQNSELYQALEKSGGKMVSFGVDFAKNAATAGRGGVVLYLIIGLVVLTSYYQTRQMMARNANANQLAPQMQMMNRVMPLMSGIFAFNLPGAVTLYFLMSNLYRIAQQALMYRFDPHLKAHMDEVREVKSRQANEPPQPRKGLLATMREQAEERESQRRGGNGNGARNGSSGPQTRPSSGRVTQPGQRGNAPRKRSKRKR